MPYTFEKRYEALYVNRMITIPDQVFEDQQTWEKSGRSFLAIDGPRYPGDIPRKIRVRLCGFDARTGGPFCRPPKRRDRGDYEE
jgi:hypothetical protein